MKRAFAFALLAGFILGAGFRQFRKNAVFGEKVGCTVDGDCGAAFYCLIGTCVPDQANGSSCTAASQCTSGNCSDSFCCNAACSGACDACSIAAGASVNGTCANLTAGAVGNPSCSPYLCSGSSAACPTDCATGGGSACVSSYFCDFSLTPDNCVADLANGQPCDQFNRQVGLNHMCSSGFCVEHGYLPGAENDTTGICCNSACAGECDQCSAEHGSVDGTCQVSDEGEIGGTSNTSINSCSPYVCDGVSTSCPGSCVDDADCDAAHPHCVNGACRDYYMSILTTAPQHDNSFCATYASEMTGDYFCWDADGSGSTGRAATLNNSPTATTYPQCPSGSDCENINVREFNGTNQYVSIAASTAPTDDFSACVMTAIDVKNGSAVEKYMQKGTDTAGTESFFISMSNLGQATFGVSKASGTTTNVSTSTASINSNTMHFLCMAYDYTSDGASILKAWQDGEEVTNSPSNVAVGPPTAGLNYTVEIMRRGESLNDQYMGGKVRLAFFTEKVLSASTVAAMSRSLRGWPLVASNGSAVTVARSGPGGSNNAFCYSFDGTIAMPMATNDPCITGKGIRAQQGTTTVENKSTKSFEFDAWTSTNGSVSVDFARAPDGLMTADKFTSTGGLAGNIKSVGFTLGNSNLLEGFSLKSETGSSFDVKLRVYDTTTTAYVGSSCQVTLGTSWDRYTCAQTGLSTTDTLNLVVEDNGTGNAWSMWLGQGTTGGVDVEPSGTTTTATSPGRENVTIANPTNNAAEGCVRFEVTFPSNYAGAMTLFGTSSTSLIELTDADTIKIKDGTNTSADGDLPWSVAGKTLDVQGTWSNDGGGCCTAIRVCDATSGTCTPLQVGAGVFDGSMGTMTTLRLGSSSSSAGFRAARFNKIRIGGPASGGCDDQ